ncbi:MAG TPA: M56 family metallopeptidase, partial [Gemmataceae bacterium]|nr:M56 family metallopeptidase [Gemmataceae bacterium]
LLTHELAHLRRSDHWVRGLEFLATGLYWWHPVVWWARREIREAEEQCCDAWVVWALPAAAKAYALALVETVDFLAEARPVLPPVASGIGHIHTLKRRLTMIMRGTTPRALTWGGLVAVLGLATTLLPLTPTWGQTDPRRDNVEEQRRRAEEALKQAEMQRQQAEQARRQALEQLEQLRRREQDDKVRRNAEDDRARSERKEREGREGSPQFDRARDEVMELGRSLKAMRLDLEKMQQQVQATEQRFKQALERLEGIRGGGRPGDEGAGSPGARPGDRRPDRGPAGQPDRGPGAGTGGYPGGQPGGRTSAPDDRGRPGGGPGFGRGGPMTGGMGGTGTIGRPGPDQERRLQDLEKKVDLLLQEISNLRRDLRDGAPGRRGGGGGGAGGRPGAGAPPGGGAGGGAGGAPGALPGSGTGTGGSNGGASGTGSAAPGAGAAAGSTSSATSKPGGSR